MPHAPARDECERALLRLQQQLLRRCLNAGAVAWHALRRANARAPSRRPRGGASAAAVAAPLLRGAVGGSAEDPRRCACRLRLVERLHCGAWVLPTAARASAASSLLGRDRRRDARQRVLVRLRSDVSRGHLQQESEDGVRTTGVRHAAEHRSQERGTAQPRRALAGSAPG